MMAGARAGLVLFLLSVACGPAQPASQPAATATSANVMGTIDRGASPTCPADEPCDPVAVALMLVFSRPGAPDVRVRVSADGTFAVHLDPGVYSIAMAPPAFHGTLQPSTVHVPESGAVVVQLRIVKSSV